MFKGLKGKTVLLFTSLIIIALSIFSVVMLSNIKPEIEDRAVNELITITNSSAKLISTYKKELLQNHLIEMAENSKKFAQYQYDLFIKGQLGERAAYNNFRNYLLDPHIGRVGESGYQAAIDSRGVLEIHPLSQGVDASEEVFMQKALTQKEGFIEYEWANVGESQSRKKSGGMAYFEPWDLIIWASSYNSEFDSIIDLDSIISTIEEQKIGHSGFSWIMDNNGEMIYHPDDLDRFTDTALLRSILDSHEECYIVTDNKADIIVYKKIPEFNWILVSQKPYKENIAVVNRVIKMILLLVPILILLFFLLISLIYTNILEPINSFSDIGQSVDSGDLTQRVYTYGEDEISTISKPFNKVLDKFSELIYSAKSSMRVLKDTVTDLNSTNNRIFNNANNQAASIREVVSTMEESEKLSKTIETKIHEVTIVSNNSKQNVLDGFKFIRRILENIEEIKEQNNHTIREIELLGHKIESISNIVNIINDIADQTKIIAFNAELEAANAGSAGSKFRIVATEIRRLADTTVNSTNEIKDKIYNIQNSSDKLLISSEEGTNRIDQGRVLSSQLNDFFKNILDSTDISVSSSEQIEKSIKYQVDAFEQILITLKDISTGTDSFVEFTNNSVTSSERLKEMAEDLNRLIDRYNISGVHNG